MFLKKHLFIWGLELNSKSLLFSVHKSDCEEFQASTEGEFFECYRESLETLSANTICMALHVLLLFPFMVSNLLQLGTMCIRSTLSLVDSGGYLQWGK